jgi:hypothetical protein
MKLTESQCWQHIANLGWGIQDCDYERIQKILYSTLPKDEIEQFSEFVHAKIGDLYDIFLPRAINGDYNMGDDSFSDLLAHIVGMGKAYYEVVLEVPDLVQIRALKLDFEESFVYIFHDPNEED